MEPLHHEAPELMDGEKNERRKRQKRRFLKALLGWRSSRQPEANATPPAPEAEHPEENRSKPLRRALRFILGAPNPETAPRPASRERSETPRHVGRLSVEVMRFDDQVKGEVEQVRQQAEATHNTEVQQEAASEVRQIDSAQAELARINAQFNQELAVRGQGEQSPTAAESQPDWASRGEQVTKRLAATPPSEAVLPTSEPQTAEQVDLTNYIDITPPGAARTEMAQPIAPQPVETTSEMNAPLPPLPEIPAHPSYEREIPRAPIATGEAATAAGGVAAYEIYRRTSPERPSTPTLSVREQYVAQEQKVRQQQQELVRQQQNRVDMREAVQRQQRVEGAVNLTRNQTELVAQTTRTMEAERRMSVPQPERPPAAPTVIERQPTIAPQPQPAERVPSKPPVEVGKQEAPQSTPPLEAARPFESPPPLRTPEAPRFEQSRPTIEAQPPAPSQESPTEQQMSARVENIGRKWMEDTPASGGQGGTVMSQTDMPSQQTPSVFSIPSAPKAAPQSSRSRHDAPEWHKPSGGWLAIAVGIIVIVGLAMLVLSL